MPRFGQGTCLDDEDMWSEGISWVPFHVLLSKWILCKWIGPQTANLELPALQDPLTGAFLGAPLRIPKIAHSMTQKNMHLILTEQGASIFRSKLINRNSEIACRSR